MKTYLRLRLVVRSAALLALFLIAGSAAAQNIGMGTKYTDLDAQVLKTLSDFGSWRAISVRDADGALETKLELESGAVVARMSFLARQRLLRVDEGRGWGPLFPIPRSLTVTTDWANAQIASLWLDRTQGAPLGLLAVPVFDGSFFRPPALANPAATEDRQRAITDSIQRVRTEFATVVVESVRNSVPPATKATTTVHSVFTARLVDRSTARKLGIMQWFPEAQTLSWELDDRTAGFINPERLAQAHLAGWPFEPNLAWANLQLYSLSLDHHPLRRLDARSHLPDLNLDRGSICKVRPSSRSAIGDPTSIVSSASRPPKPGLRRVFGKNQVGCDVLTFFNDTIFEPCCHQHDACYGYDEDGDPTVPEPCTWKSWLFVEGWSCTKCNAEALWCFLTGGTTADDDPFNQDPCRTDGPSDFCSAECWSCSW